MNNEHSIPSIQMIPEARVIHLENSIQEILLEIKKIKPGANYAEYLTAKEFMAALKIGRSKFDELIATNSIEYIRKGRKLYIHTNQIQKYFHGE